MPRCTRCERWYLLRRECPTCLAEHLRHIERLLAETRAILQSEPKP
jgi:hypothetical protein